MSDTSNTLTPRRSYRASLIGLRFGRLSVVSKNSRTTKSGDSFWDCVCDCGKTKTTAGGRLKYGVTKSCGCIREGVRVLDLTGQRFGRLVAVEICGADQFKRKIWRCLCDCGNVTETPSGALRQGLVVSCGCYSREVAAMNGKAGAHKHSGSLSRLYKPEITDDEREGKRSLPAVNEWRRKVFERDGFACVLCGAAGVRLNAHHLNCWSLYPDLRFEISNGATLCEVHHTEFHSSMGGVREPCTANDFDNFKTAFYVNREIEKRDGRAGL